MLAVAVSLAGCTRRDGPPPEAYRHLADHVLASFHLDEVFRPCRRKEKVGGIVVWGSTPTDDCYVMRPPERVRGLWYDAFEGTRFLPGRTMPPADLRNAVPNWAIGHGRSAPVLPFKLNGRFVYMDVIGRRTRFNVTWNGRPEFIVDRIIAQRVVQPGRGDPGGPPPYAQR